MGFFFTSYSQRVLLGLDAREHGSNPGPKPQEKSDDFDTKKCLGRSEKGLTGRAKFFVAANNSCPNTKEFY
jgi:hypothetical protein